MNTAGWLILGMSLLANAGLVLWRRYPQAEPGGSNSVLLRAGVDACVVFRLAGSIVDASCMAAQMLGCQPDVLRQKTLAELDRALNAEAAAVLLAEIGQAGSKSFNACWCCGDGRDIDLEISAVYVPENRLVYAFLRDLGPEHAAQQRIEHLHRFYLFLSRANCAIAKRTSIEEILQAVCDAAVEDEQIRLAWAGIVDTTASRVIPLMFSGIAADYAKDIVITTDPALATSRGPTGRCATENRIIYTDDFIDDQRTEPWHERARYFGLNSSVAIPIAFGGTVRAVMTLYSGSKGYFDEDYQKLLEEVGNNISLAWQTLLAGEAYRRAVQHRFESEFRFDQLFDASPLPMQIHSLSTGETRAINKAHERAFGYSLQDIPDMNSWLSAAYGEGDYRQQVDQIWRKDLARVIEHGPDMVVQSPELSLRSKDGGQRIVHGFACVHQDDIIVQWLDLTEYRQATAELIEREKHFSELVEHTQTGIYVTGDDNLIVYVNPRFCQIIGWPREALTGHDPLSFLTGQPASAERMLQIRQQMDAGMPSVALTIPCLTHDQREIILGVHANRGTWNNLPATIVMAQDITERQHANERIAAYVQQLEQVMRGTLEAVAKMVDMRDPYTAGHERRVGLLAAKIGEEMGWDAQHCLNLELIGLVHDIGKIAIPSDLLTKPSRLSTIEYQLIQTHVEKGYEILKDVNFTLPIADIIRQHHERLDGSGYPNGLKGEAILPEARILAVADVLESMASHRPYRPSLGLSAGLGELERHKGLWYDPDVVDAVVRLIRDKGYVLPA